MKQILISIGVIVAFGLLLVVAQVGMGKKSTTAGEITNTQPNTKLLLGLNQLIREINQCQTFLYSG
ncbi:hypothetical protein [Moorena sp. SIO4A5]|uniref:hypothetical protein n=1 Tax=Moorena sp. SIO4A5 TaxID=2607838 RepID=UPI0025FD729A|nr:hypothetical protein [Moorena sp. SIO4A5]